VARFTPRPLYPQGKGTWYPSDRLGAPELNLYFLAPKNVIADVEELFAAVGTGKSKGCPRKLFVIVL